MGKARKNSVQVNFGILEKRMEVLGISKAGISEQLGYSKAWFNSAKINGGRIRVKDAKDISDLLGLKFEDVIAPEPVQPEADVAENAIKLTTPIAIDQADAIVTGLADAVRNQTADIIERVDALTDGVMRLNENVGRVLDFISDYVVYLNRAADKMEKVLDKMEELKN